MPQVQHENDLLLEFPNYWDSYETTIDMQIYLIDQINQGDYQQLERLSPYYSKLITLLFDKLYCADYHHIYKAVILEENNSMNRDVINEFFKINFAKDNFNYENLLHKIRHDIVNAVKEYTYNLPLDKLKDHAYQYLDKYISSFEQRYWLRIEGELPQQLSQLNYDTDNFISFRRAKQLEAIICPQDPNASFFLKTEILQHKTAVHALYGEAVSQMQTTYFINLTREEFFNKKL